MAVTERELMEQVPNGAPDPRSGWARANGFATARTDSAEHTVYRTSAPALQPAPRADAEDEHEDAEPEPWTRPLEVSADREDAGAPFLTPEDFAGSHPVQPRANPARHRVGEDEDEDDERPPWERPLDISVPEDLK